MASSWFHQVTGVTPRRLLVAAAALTAGVACIVAVRCGSEQAIAALQRAKTKHAAAATRKVNLCVVDGLAVVPGQQPAAKRWVVLRTATFPFSCVHSADRAEFDRLTKMLDNLPTDDAAWVDALHKRGLLVRRGEQATSEKFQ